MYKFAYIFGNTILACLWLLLFFKRKDLNRQQMVMSILLGIFGPLADYVYIDYWKPEYIASVSIKQIQFGLESIIFAFLIGGITSVVYEFVFRKRPVLGKPRNSLLFMCLILAFSMVFVLKTIGLNSIWASILSFTFISILMMLSDRKLVADAFWTSLLMIIVTLGLYKVLFIFSPDIISKFWLPEALSGIGIFNIPIEEIMWFATAGISMGIFYEFWLNAKGYKDK